MSQAKLEQLWFTRCPVPTATGLAYKLGWLEEDFARDNIKLSTLQEIGGDLAHHHYDHELASLIREGGNLFAIPAKGQGAPSKLIGLTWIDEGQAIIVRPDSDIRSAQDLKGKRLGLPAFREADILENKRGRSISRGMSLAGYHGALRSAGLTLDDVKLVELSGRLPASSTGQRDPASLTHGLEPLLNGKVDGIYIKGAAAAEAARQHGAVVGIDLDLLPERRFRVNNGTPRPITVHNDLLENHFDLVVRFLYQTLRAADWAKNNLQGVYDILKSETRSGQFGVEAAYRKGFNENLAPDLSDERLALFRQQKEFQLVHGFLDHDFDFDAWVDHRPLAAAYQLLAEEKAHETRAAALLTVPA